MSPPLALRRAGDSRSAIMTLLTRCWTVYCLIPGLALLMLGLPADANAAPVCLGAGLVCEDHYTETQACEDGSEKGDVSCHKYGICEAAGDASQSFEVSGVSAQRSRPLSFHETPDLAFRPPFASPL